MHKCPRSQAGDSFVSCLTFTSLDGKCPDLGCYVGQPAASRVSSYRPVALLAIMRVHGYGPRFSLHPLCRFRFNQLQGATMRGRKAAVRRRTAIVQRPCAAMYSPARDSVWQAARDTPRDRISSAMAASSQQVAWQVALWLNCS